MTAFGFRHKSVGLLCLSFLCKAVFSLDCFVCSSDDSFEECDKARTKEICQPRTTCGKLSFQLSDNHRYRRGCLSVIYCTDPSRYCQNIVDASECVTACCSKDLCNAAPAQEMSRDGFLWWSLMVTSVGLINIC
ncbi:unnamed protein product [Pocillopora meandrina]|uniref:Uncharacterized protein n=1 Tax=Pocillopora meandrina TaxID=46732 RepID=A0AAU9W3U9_9CNID|nr:unnamed protein product [Pocillopora meandrina]